MTIRLITKDDVKICKGKYYLPWFKNQELIRFNVPNKVVVFDLDETLGSFADLYILWRGLTHVWPDCPIFNELFDLFPEFLRYGILTILEYLYDKKIKNECKKIFIYTNNQCSSEWVHKISLYLETKVKNASGKSKLLLFDKTICAFKIKNKRVETNRTGHRKKIDDFRRCSSVSESADICFIDDLEYPDMKSAKVYYICPRPHIHNLSTNTIIKRVIHASWIRPGLLSNESFWRSWFHIHRYNRRRGYIDLELDLQVSQKIIYHLREFMMFKVKNKKGGRITIRNKKWSTIRITKKLKW